MPIGWAGSLYHQVKPETSIARMAVKQYACLLQNTREMVTQARNAAANVPEDKQKLEPQAYSTRRSNRPNANSNNHC